MCMCVFVGRLSRETILGYKAIVLGKKLWPEFGQRKWGWREQEKMPLLVNKFWGAEELGAYVPFTFWPS